MPRCIRDAGSTALWWFPLICTWMTTVCALRSSTMAWGSCPKRFRAKGWAFELLSSGACARCRVAARRSCPPWAKALSCDSNGGADVKLLGASRREPDQADSFGAVLGLAGPRAVVVAVALLSITLLQAATALAAVKSPLVVFLAFAILAATTIGVMRSRAEPLSRRTAWFAVGSLAIVSAMVCANYHPNATVGFASWQLGATANVGLVLAIRGRPGAAWGGFVVSNGTMFLWAFVAGQPWGVPVSLGITPLVLTVGGTAFSRTIRRTFAAARQAQESTESARLAAEYIRAQAHRRVAAAARPVLVQARDSGVLDQELRHAAAVAETRLRDTIHAPAFADGPLAEVIAEARERGVTVRLRDDSSRSLDEPHVQALVHRASEVMRGLDRGEVTVRVQPQGRGVVGTIGVSGAEDGFELVTVSES